jgi:DNA-binding NarL/FixJ family response regulator
VIGETSKGEEAVQLATELRPDVVLMDIKLDGKTALMQPGK